ncbi:hypothetical protein MLD38_034748 [Melastoma candidum]|uniref:Uncharacterized protein n=1 Tax=Melastoma candidum TaxID=119954 RepID=A0ACB9MB10_9MYRT|nr:hypothetical protein MLD38_034748 [Melastoma candidum]
MMRSSALFSGGMTEHSHEFNNGFPNGGGDDDLSDDGSQMMLGEKKKRLCIEQVKALERSFETRNKLEPERKSQLARSLGLQPRQVAIWFQNRRARWKTKQLERDYEVLKRQVGVLKADNDTLHAQNEKLRAEIMEIKARRDTNESKPSHGNYPTTAEVSNWCNGGSDLNPDISRSSLIDSLKLDQNDVRDDSTNLCNIFGVGVEVSHPGFWPWTVAVADHNTGLHQS